MRWQLLLQQSIADPHRFIVLLEELVNPRQHHGQVGEDLHFLRKFVINVVVREACILKAVVHSLEGLHHRRNTFIEYDLVEAQLLEDGQVVIPEFYGTVEDQPRLACL